MAVHYDKIISRHDKTIILLKDVNMKTYRLTNNNDFLGSTTTGLDPSVLSNTRVASRLCHIGGLESIEALGTRL